MTMKKTDLVKSLAKKLDGQLKATGIPGRFAQGASEHVDKREQRRLDAAAGLVPFACKLPSALAARLREQAAVHAGGMNGLVAELLTASLETAAIPAKRKAAKSAAAAIAPAAGAAHASAQESEHAAKVGKVAKIPKAPKVPKAATQP